MSLVCVALALLLPIVSPLRINKNLPSHELIVGQILCLGVFANSMVDTYYALLHAKGRADLTARLHLVEFPIFVIALDRLLQWMA